MEHFNVEVLVPVTEEKELETFLFLFSLVIWESMTSQLFLLLQQIVNTYLQMFCVKLMDVNIQWMTGD